MKKDLLLLLLMFLPLLRAHADDSGSCGDNVTYTYVEETHTLTISGTGPMKEYQSSSERPWNGFIEDEIEKIVIEDGITVISRWIFYSFESVTTVIIPSTVTLIEEGAFDSCSSLTSVVIPNSVTTIGDEAFNECLAMTSLTISNGVTMIGESAFDECRSLTSLVIPNSVQTIGGNAFSRCNNLSSVTIMCSPVEVGNSVFSCCDKLEQVVFDCEKVVSNIFIDCPIKKVTISENVTSIDKYAFYNWDGIKTITIPQSVTSIGEYAFCKCTSLENVEFHNGLQAIDHYAFSECTSLQTVCLPESMETIGYFAFSECTSLQAITFPEGLGTIANSAFSGCTSLQTITFPERLETIEGSAFSGCTSLQTITFPERLETIGENAYSGCENLQSITLPESLVNIENCAFADCKAIKSISIPKNVQMTDNSGYYSPFKGCTSLEIITIECENFGNWFNDLTSIKSIHLGEGVKNITYYSSFKGLTGLETIIVDDDNAVYDSRDNCNAVIETVTNTLLQGCNTTTIPESVTAIGEGAFSGMTGITEITLPADITDIGGEAFYGCTALNTINSYIEKPFSISAFDDATRSTATLHVPFLTSMSYKNWSGWDFATILEMDGSAEDMAIIEFADPVAKQVCVSNWDVNEDGEICMGEVKLVTDTSDLFYNMSNKTELVSFDELKYFINVTNIGNNTFYGCTGLESISIPSKVTAIGASAFSDCTKLKSIELPDGLLAIDSYAFRGCSSLKSINLPEGLTTIGESAFYQSGLNTMTIPSTVTSIGDYALAGMIIYCNLTTPISVGTLMSNASETILYVPEGCEEAFRQANGWKDFLIVGTGSEITDWSVGEVTAVVEEPGELRLALVEMDEEEITRLKVRGKLNSTDIKYLIEGTGKIANLESLDLSDVTFDYDGGCYYSKSEMYGDLYGYYLEEQYYLTEEDFITHPSHGAFSHTTTNAYHSPYLAGVFMNKDYKHIVMPKIFKKAARKILFNCKQLQSVEYPGGIDYVDVSAFAGCSLLQTITLAETDTICNEAFSGCTMLKTVENISRVKSIGEQAFLNCKFFTGDNGVLQLSQVDSIANMAFNGCMMLNDVRLSDNIYYIGERAFAGCTSLSAITLPNSLKALSTGAFQNCSTLESVTYSSELTELDYTCFYNTPFMDNLPTEGGVKYMGTIALSYDFDSNVATTSPATLTFREGTTLIADNFIESLNYNYNDYRSNVTQLNLPSTLVRIGEKAFYNSKVATITLPESMKEIEPEAFRYSSISKLNLSESLTAIGDYAFDGIKITSLKYNLDGITGKNIFMNCKSLEKVTIGTKVQLLPEGIFSGCTALTIVKSEERTDGTSMDIGNSAFSGCSNLAKVTLPEDVVTIGDGAFSDCSSLKSFTTSESLMTIGVSAFFGCSGLTSFIMNEGLKIIGGDAFGGCSQIPTFQLPESIDSIGSGAFMDCSAITSLTIPVNTRGLGYGFIQGCTNLTELKVYFEVPPQNVPGYYDGVTLYVPDGCKPLYQEASGWNRFETILEFSNNDITARNKLAVADVNVSAGKTAIISVELTNDVTDFTAYQFDIVLPFGLTIDEDDIIMGTRYSSSNPTVSFKKLAIDKIARKSRYRFALFDLNGGTITGTEGELLKVIVRTSNTLLPQKYEASVENAIFVQSDATKSVLDKVKFNIVVGEGDGVLLGDVNGDGDVDIADAVCIVNYVVGKPNTTFIEAAADANGDGDIDIADAVHIVNLVVGKITALAPRIGWNLPEPE